MAAQRLTLSFSDGITPSTGHNYGPLTVSPGPFELVRAIVRGSIIFQPAITAPNGQLANVVVYGISAVATGSAPPNLTTAPNSSSWLTWQAHPQGSYSIVSSSSTSSYIYGWADPIRQDWEGHLPFAAGTDFYFQQGFFAGPFGQQWCAAGTIDLWFN